MKKIFKSKRITIMGLGLHGGGVGVAKFFCQQGARVLVTDLKTKEQLAESLRKLRGLEIEYVLGSHRQKDFIETDMIIKNPGAPSNSPYLAIARENKVKIETDISIFFDLIKNPIIGVTGTKGKSTTATLIYSFLKKAGKGALLAGNIGITPLEIAPKIKNNDIFIVLELSSFELEGLTKSPKVAVITNILKDHLNRYARMDDYVLAKKNIFANQKKDDIAVLNYDDLEVRKMGESVISKKYYYTRKPTPKNEGCFVKNNQIFFNNEADPIFPLKNLLIFGEHNVSDVLAAVAAVKALNVQNSAIQKVLAVFKGVPSRQELVAEINGVKYFNDTTATMPEATMAAISVFRKEFVKSNLILIAGGEDKNLDYSDLAKEIIKKVNQLILLPGTASEKIKNELRAIKKRYKFLEVGSMKKAVAKAKEIAAFGDVVLLSPSAASFNLFDNEFDRGKQFKEAVFIQNDGQSKPEN